MTPEAIYLRLRAFPYSMKIYVNTVLKLSEFWSYFIILYIFYGETPRGSSPAGKVLGENLCYIVTWVFRTSLSFIHLYKIFFFFHFLYN